MSNKTSTWLSRVFDKGVAVLGMLLEGHFQLVGIMLVGIILSLSLHEFGHAGMATLLGDNTPRLAGRLTLNPIPHIDPIGLLMVVLVSFGYAKPVPFNPRNIRQIWGAAAVAVAGPLMNLLLAVVAVNGYILAIRSGVIAQDSLAAFSLIWMARINLLLMLFNLIPLGPLDGHYIMSWFLPPRLGYQYDQFNARYGNMVFMALIILSIAGVPVFRALTNFAGHIIPYLIFV